MTGNMALRKYVPSGDATSNMKSLSFSCKRNDKAQLTDPESSSVETDVDIDLSEVYFLIMHFLSAGPCHRTYGQFWNELLEHQLLPRRYHAWYSRSGADSRDENDNGLSFPLSYNKLVERYPHIEKDHLVKLLKQLILNSAAPSQGVIGGGTFSAAAVPTLLGTGSFSLLHYDQTKVNSLTKPPQAYLRWPHMQADQVCGLSLREIGGGFTRHHRAPSVRAACYAIAKPSTMVQKMQNIKTVRGHLNAVYCAIFDRSGRYVITGSDDRLVKIWSMETAYCLASCRGHEGDITDLAVNSNNFMVASASNDCIIRVWHLPDGHPISVLRGHTGAVTAIAFNPRPVYMYHLLSSSDDGTCRMWDARYSHMSPRIYVPRPSDALAGAVKNNGPSSSTSQQRHQIFCCAFNANGTVFVTGSSDTLARVWSACKYNTDESEPNHEIDVLSGHENDVNYVQFSGCSVASRYSVADTSKEENIPKFKNTWLNHDNIVTCSRDGSAIIWIPRSRRSHGKVGRWIRAYHLKVPPPPLPPQPPRGGPRQRILPTPRGVNMIIWSLDNRFVLAAIMDCRICVWNAVDGSLVHSLTGHSESTYVLDVHPFNPRIAMSAGYDGKTIVWDIWEGTPIRTYEIGRFKLVDGKFSPDGTSIILSDDVGQLYILSTGQGESQKDAKYDQFFLGDYRPIVQDTHGNVLDQETQLMAHRRNMQDLLCDASMIPYTEPYQSLYQQRRLGALGSEWRPSSVRFAVGPDFSMDRNLQILPVADLDLLNDPLPAFIDAMDWEPENEVQSDDTDSEYNVTEEYSSGGEQGSLSSNSSGDTQSSAEASGVQGNHKDGLRRSKRKKKKAEAAIMTSSGRRIKRRNLDEFSGDSLRDNQSRKSRHSQKASRKKSSSSKPLRPRRAAARNALTLFTRITGMSTDAEDEDGLDGDSSESRSMLQDSIIGSEASDDSLQNRQHEHIKGKEVLLDKSDDVDKPHQYSGSHMNAGNKTRLVLKLPRRDLSQSLSAGHIKLECDKNPHLVGSSSTSLQENAEANQNYFQDPENSPGDLNCSQIERSKRVEHPKVESHLHLLEGYDQKFNWGGSKARTSKRLKMGEIEPLPFTAYADSSLCLQGHVKTAIGSNGHPILEKECGEFRSSSGTQLYGGQGADGAVHMIQKLVENGTPEDFDGAGNNNEHSSFNKHQDCVELPKQDHKVVDEATTSVPYINEIDNSHELKENSTATPRKLRIRSTRTSEDYQNCSKVKIKSSAEDGRNGRCDELFESSNTKETLNSEVPGEDLTCGDQNGLRESGGPIDRTCGSFSQDSRKSNSHDKMYNVVYKKRSKSTGIRSNPEGDCVGVKASTSNVSNCNIDVGIDSPKATTNGVRQTRSMGLRVSIHSTDTELREEQDGMKDAPSGVLISSSNACNERPSEEWGSGSRVTVGLRSVRNRRSSYNICETSRPDRKKSHQSARNSWLMLATHEEGSRYIPQLGDEVVYLRQGHQEYLSSRRPKDRGPWETIKGNIRAVEFCRVIALEYIQRSDGAYCKMTLQFVDTSSPVTGESFILILPELTGFPDFLVERNRYDAATRRNWTSRDKCQVWWKNEGEENGSWWEGRIISVKPKSSEFPDSPWERYFVKYKSEPNGELFQHSPWELHDAETQWERPCISAEIREKLLSSLYELEESGTQERDYYGIRKLKLVSSEEGFINRFPVPLTLELIQARLENNYYRSYEAVENDISVFLSNAESYIGKNAERRLSNWFNRTLSSLQVS